VTYGAVLAVGLDPAYADFSHMPDLTPRLIRVFIREQTDRIRALGFEVVDCLISPDEAGELALEAALRARSFDCVVIGAGLREPPHLLIQLEKAVNAIHRLAPRASICFNSSPADTAQAVLRWM
jgi:hypothetical protein